MSSSSDIEKLFDHFGGDASAYQEIGRENEAHSARTRWPLLVTLDLRQPLIPPIGQRGQARPQPVADKAAALAIERQDPAAPKDAASVTRAKAPLFTRSHRRDIPPVAVAAAAPDAPRGASRFGAPETNSELAKAPASKAADAASSASTPVSPATGHADPVAAVVPPARIASVAPLVPVSAMPPIAPVVHSAPAIAASNPPAAAARTSAAAPAWAQAPAPARADPGAARTQHVTPASASARMQPGMSTPVPVAAQQPASILGKLFASQAEAAPLRAAAPVTQAVPLQSLFDRLRGTPRAATASAGAAEPAEPNSWLVNGPRRS
ncbi:hypothetical protein LMG28727_03316 [Paraburkholderia kirstenboschensis]|uniref:cellulose biosynthesis protein BcsP n=1 Tax=Paraburkholderia kirstenboschensis TaxID=1245436 RepID=UPI001918926F|nr:cellulose biosynthesis protein BcsP [Paraburkholderia kirstenboschensis]CAD6536213.1 hypothetical protein LMG28727_03316 [Paraburkholderia kirstenboschensis]